MASMARMAMLSLPVARDNIRFFIATYWGDRPPVMNSAPRYQAIKTIRIIAVILALLLFAQLRAGVALAKGETPADNSTDQQQSHYYLVQYAQQAQDNDKSDKAERKEKRKQARE